MLSLGHLMEMVFERETHLEMRRVVITGELGDVDAELADADLVDSNAGRKK